MRFKLDENLPVDLTGLFRSAGHDSSSVFEQKLSGEQDSRLLEICRKERRVLVSLDLDFSDVRTYPPGENQGIIVLRLQKQDKHYVEQIISRLLHAFESEPIEKRLWIVDENRIRIRS